MMACATEMEKIDVLAQGEMPDARMLFHDETARENPGETNVTGRMNGITEQFLEERSPERPREQKRKQHHDVFHDAGASER